MAERMKWDKCAYGKCRRKVTKWVNLNFWCTSHGKKMEAKYGKKKESTGREQITR